MSDVETRSVEIAELKAGIRLIAGHRVVLVVNGATGSKRTKGKTNSPKPTTDGVPQQ
jgi:hypothetical protein